MLRNLITRRLDCELSQQQLADLCFVSRNTISNIERGIYKPNIYLAIRICKTLGLNTYLIGWLFECQTD